MSYMALGALRPVNIRPKRMRASSGFEARESARSSVGATVLNCWRALAG